jgi:hypothetical protein
LDAANFETAKEEIGNAKTFLIKFVLDHAFNQEITLRLGDHSQCLFIQKYKFFMGFIISQYLLSNSCAANLLIPLSISAKFGRAGIFLFWPKVTLGLGCPVIVILLLLLLMAD